MIYDPRISGDIVEIEHLFERLGRGHDYAHPEVGPAYEHLLAKGKAVIPFALRYAHNPPSPRFVASKSGIALYERRVILMCINLLNEFLARDEMMLEQQLEYREILTPRDKE